MIVNKRYKERNINSLPVSLSLALSYQESSQVLAETQLLKIKRVCPCPPLNFIEPCDQELINLI